MGNHNTIYNSNTQTLIGTTKETLINQETGEVIQVDHIIKRTYGSKQFWKMYLMDFLAVLGIIDSKQLDVFIYIAQNTQPSQNMFFGTYDDISKAINVSRPTIAKIMKKLQDNNFLRPYHRGVWRVNPNILMKGDEQKRQILLSYYESSEPNDNEITVVRGKHKKIDITAPKNIE